MEVYLRTGLDIDEVASIIATAINVAPTNRSLHQRVQRRESLNRGGTYFLFETFGLELLLLQNLGEVQIPDRSEWNYYLLVASADAGNSKFLAGICMYLATILKKEGLEAEVDDLAA